MKQMPSRKKLTMVTLVLALGVAVYLNWEYAKNDAGQFSVATGAQVSDDQLVTVSETDTKQPVADSTSQDINKNYGDAQLVSLSKDSSTEYFDQAKLDRSKARDEALDKLQKALKNTSLMDEEKQTLTDQLSATLGDITTESEIENIIKAKGFTDCVVYLDGEKANVTVMTSSGELNASQVAQIRDAVQSKASIEAKNITVVEVK